MALEIRPAQASDARQILVLAALMTQESPRYCKHEFSLDKAICFFDTLLEHGGLFVAISDEQIIGFFAGFVMEHFLSNQTFASDAGVYVLPEHRGGSAFVRLVKAFEAWARERGASEIHLGTSTGVQPEKTVRMYERLGYTMNSYGLLKTEV